MRKKLIIYSIIFMCVIVTFCVTISIFTLPSGKNNIPLRYSRLYEDLSIDMDSFRAKNPLEPDENASPIFGAELLLANSNRGEDLLKEETLENVKIYLDALASMDVRGVSIELGYPILSSDLPRQDDYKHFYQEVVKEAKARNIAVHIETGVTFREKEFSKLDFDYSGLTLQKLKDRKKEITKIIVEEIEPDFFSLTEEPDTEAKNSGLTELNTASVQKELIEYQLEGLDLTNIKIGAGSGNWSDRSFIETYAKMEEIDYIDLHIYPINGTFLENVLEYSAIAKSHGKQIIVGETWLYKASDLEIASGLNVTKILARDAYSFWQPLDEKFLELLVDIAKSENFLFISPFWSKYFFGNIEYNLATAFYSPTMLLRKSDQKAWDGIQDSKLTPTGEVYKSLIKNQ